jgi:hypothetical protein
MNNRLVHWVIAVIAWTLLIFMNVSAQDTPLPAQPPDVGDEEPSLLRDIFLQESDLPARQAEEVLFYHEPELLMLQEDGTNQVSRPIPIPDTYATFQGVTLDIPSPGLIANDYHPDGLSFILTSFFAPVHGTLPSIVTNGAFRYEPPPDFTGTDTFRYSLRDEDGIFSEFITVTIEVLPDPNRSPIPVQDEYATLMDVQLDVSSPGLIANDIDPDGDTFILSNFFSPEHGSLPSIVTNGAFRYIPPTGFTGIDIFRYILRDSFGAFSEPDTVRIHVIPPGGDHPVAIPNHYVTMEGQTLDIPAPGLIANDIDPDGDTFILTNFFQPENGSLPSIVTNGAFRYEPNPGYTGIDTFRYRIQNNKGNFSEYVTVTIEVLPDFNRPPVPITNSYGIPVDGILDIPAPGLIANDVDPDGDSFILSNFFQPDHGSLPSIVTNGAFRYIPPAGFRGVDTFRYRLMDSHGLFSDYMDVTIFVGTDIVETPSAITLLTPGNTATDISILPQFAWQQDTWAETYRFQLASDINFDSILTDEELSETSYSLNEPIHYQTEYYWRVQGVNELGAGDWSTIRSFTTSEVPYPENLVLNETENGIELIWDVSSNLELSYYRIYKGSSAGQLFIYDISGSDQQSFFDSDISEGPSFYSVTAVDKIEQESSFSDVVSYFFASFNVSEQWALISLPLDQGELQFKNSRVFQFDQVYRPDTLIVPLKGYWVRNDVEEVVEARGAGADSASIDLAEGWNLIGSLIDSVSVESIGDPENILTSASLYRYEGSGYQETGFLTPGDGFWIHAGQPGTINLKIDSTPSDTKQQLFAGKVEQKEEKEFIHLVLSDGLSEQYYHISESKLSDEEKVRYLLPPGAPGLSLDIRSQDGYRVADTFPAELMISASSFPVSLSISGESEQVTGKIIQLHGSARGEIDLFQLLPGEEIFITREYDSFILDLIENEELFAAIEETGIEPVYPNPFNSQATIRYQLARQVNVKLELYDVIGRRIAVLTDSVQEAGTYTQILDAARFSSGLYFLRFQAGDVHHIQKLTLIR